jgi:hypothetical protein
MLALPFFQYHSELSPLHESEDTDGHGHGVLLLTAIARKRCNAESIQGRISRNLLSGGIVVFGKSKTSNSREIRGQFLFRLWRRSRCRQDEGRWTGRRASWMWKVQKEIEQRQQRSLVWMSSLLRLRCMYRCYGRHGGCSSATKTKWNRESMNE